MRTSLAKVRKPLRREVVQSCPIRGLIPQIPELATFCKGFDKACEARRQFVLADAVRKLTNKAEAGDEDLDIRTC